MRGAMLRQTCKACGKEFIGQTRTPCPRCGGATVRGVETALVPATTSTSDLLAKADVASAELVVLDNQLHAQIAVIEVKIKQVINIRIEIPWTDRGVFGFGKQDGRWGFIVADKDGSHARLLLEAGREMKAAALNTGAIAQLILAAGGQYDVAIEQRKQAIEVGSMIMAALESVGPRDKVPKVDMKTDVDGKPWEPK